MALTPLIKKTYVYGIDPVSSANLNQIQDAIIEMQNNYTDPDDIGDLEDLEPAANDLVDAINTAQYEIGAIKGSVAEAYSNLSTYDVGDYCVYDYTLYQCVTEISAAEDFAPSHWSAITIIGELKEVREKTKTCIVMTPSFTSLPQTYTDSQLTFLSYVDHLTEDMIIKPSDYIASNASAMGDDWDIIVNDGELTISGTFSGSTGTNLKLFFSYI